MCYYLNMNDLDKAKKELKDDITCVIVKGDNIYTSKDSSIRPLLNLINEGKDLNGYSLADKVIGKAQAYLCIKAGIKSVFTYNMSKEAIKLLDKYNIKYEYITLVDNILNNKGDDVCPMEKKVKDINNVELAYIALNDKVRELFKKGID